MFGSPEDYEPEPEDDYDFWERTEDMLDDGEKAMKEMESSWTDGTRGNMPTSDKYRDEDSDIDIISSDGIRFRVHTSILKRVSLVHQSSLPSQNPPYKHHSHDPITLTNNDIGHSVVLTEFLDLVYPNLSVNLNDGLLNRRVIRLAREWKCLYVLDRMFTGIQISTHPDIGLDEDSARSVVITSVGLEDPVLLGTVVAKSAHILCDPAWNDMDYICKGIISASPPYNNGAQRPACLNFGCWSLEDYQSIPPTVIWALGIAKRGHETNSFQAGRAFEAQLCFAYHRKGHSPFYDRLPRSKTCPDDLMDQGMVHDYHVKKASNAKQAESFDFAAKWTGVNPPQPSVGQWVRADPGSEYDDGRADLIMVSSDGTHFKVHSAILANASPVFSSMISLARAADPSKSIVFFDRELENQTVVYALLDAIYKYELPPLYQTSTILYLIDLADKWGVQVVLKIVRKNLEAAFWLSSTRNFDLFLIAIKLKEYRLAADFSGRAESPSRVSYCFPPIQIYDRRAPKPRHDHEMYTRLYDINTCRYEDFIQLPPKVAWALQRSTLMWDHGVIDNYELRNCDAKRLAARRTHIAQSFRRIMDPKFKPAKMPPPGSRGFATASS